MDLTYLNWERGKIPASYHPTNWQEMKERCLNDYGPPERSNGPEVAFEDLERTEEYYERNGAPF